MFRIFNAVVHWAHRLYAIPEIMLEFVTIEFTETDPYLFGKDKISLLGRKSQRQISQEGELLIKILP